jgi:uncharacterized protein involved in exopolysaccharide biosynthesis
MTPKPLYDYHLLDLIVIFNKFKKQILLVTILACLASAIVAMLLPVYYKSTTILYPINLTLSDKGTIFGEQASNSEFSYYGNKFDASRLLATANSSQVIDYIINKYHLVAHYNQDTQTQYIYTKTKEAFLKNYSAFKNEKDAIEITLYDTDKNLCANMVNDIAQKIDEISSKPIEESKMRIIKMLQIEMDKKNKRIDSIQNNQVALSNKSIELANLENEKATLSKSLNQYNVTINEKVSTISILEQAYPAEKKSKPTRWIIVVLSTVGTFFFALLVAILLEQYAYLKNELK